MIGIRTDVAYEEPVPDLMKDHWMRRGFAWVQDSAKLVTAILTISGFVTAGVSYLLPKMLIWAGVARTADVTPALERLKAESAGQAVTNEQINRKLDAIGARLDAQQKISVATNVKLQAINRTLSKKQQKTAEEAQQ